MSRQDILTVATLAAHLAQESISRNAARGASICASDALLLQKLGARARRNETRHSSDSGYTQSYYMDETARIEALAASILKPYGLRATVGGDCRGSCFGVLGLPGTSLGGDSEGFRI